MKKLVLALAATTAAIAFGAAPVAAQDKTKACWIYVGPIGDFGYSYQHHQGLLDRTAARKTTCATGSTGGG